MSWKSFVSAGLLCVLASPVFAAPTLRVVNGPALNAQGNWVWTVSVQPSFADTPVAAELGFTANRTIVGTPTAGALFDTTNPGNVIFGWETLTDVDPGPGVNMKPVGVQVEPIGNDGTINQVFAALGSAILPNSPTQSTLLTIVTTGPTNTNLTGSLQVLGAYGAGSNEGRLAELTGATTSANYRDYVGTATRTIKNGDINLDGFSDGSDFAIFGGQYAPGVAKNGGWTIGDFNRDGFVDGADFAIFGGAYAPGVPGGSISNLTVTGVLDPPGSGSGAGVVPEPTSVALLGLAMLGGLGLFRRRRA